MVYVYVCRTFWVHLGIVSSHDHTKYYIHVLFRIFKFQNFQPFCLKEKFEKLENLKILVYQKSKIFKLSNFFNFSFKNWLFFPPLIPSILLCFPPSNVLLLMDEKGDQRRSARGGVQPGAVVRYPLRTTT